MEVWNHQLNIGTNKWLLSHECVKQVGILIIFPKLVLAISSDFNLQARFQDFKKKNAQGMPAKIITHSPSFHQSWHLYINVATETHNNSHGH